MVSADLCIQRKSHGGPVADIYPVPWLCHWAILVFLGLKWARHALVAGLISPFIRHLQKWALERLTPMQVSENQSVARLSKNSQGSPSPLKKPLLKQPQAAAFGLHAVQIFPTPPEPSAEVPLCGNLSLVL